MKRYAIEVTPPPAAADGPLPDAMRRNFALAATREGFEGKPFRPGRADCLVMIHSHLVAMGHKLPKVPRYSSMKGAKAALAAQGVETIEALIDKYLPRIAPAAMLPGDVGLLPGAWDDEETQLDGALVIGLGRKFWGWHPDAQGMAVLEPVGFPISVAWRA